MWIFLDLTEKELAALRRLAGEKELSEAAVLRLAFRLYHDVDLRLGRGEQVFVPGPPLGCGSDE